jgi:antitoxin component of MazEF toxin-antitoxin module
MRWGNGQNYTVSMVIIDEVSSQVTAVTINNKKLVVSSAARFLACTAIETCSNHANLTSHQF